MTPFLEELAARRRFGMRPGLESISELLAALGSPERKMKAIHVAGTNGKGAVVAMIDAALRGAGCGRVGRYTSPHLIRINERFVLDGACVDDARLDALAARVAASAEGKDVTFFEALTAVAFLLYAEEKVDYAVLECGLGGRLDATNVCLPVLTVITRIGLDHCDWLGSSVEAIAAEKAGIIKSGVPIVLGANESSVRQVIESKARELGAPFFYAPDLVSENEIPTDFPLLGSFQRENAMTALAALKVLLPGNDAAMHAISSVSWPGRFQRLGSFLIDGAHNPPGARALARALSEESHPVKRTLVFAACGDKDINEVLHVLRPFVSSAYAVATRNPRAVPADELAARMTTLGIPSEPCASIPEALSKASAKGEALVCGSLFLVGEVLACLTHVSAETDPSESLREMKS